jgi:tryptophan synthase beta subunit
MMKHSTLSRSSPRSRGSSRARVFARHRARAEGRPADVADEIILANLSGRGDKDVSQAAALLLK